VKFFNFNNDISFNDQKLITNEVSHVY